MQQRSPDAGEYGARTAMNDPRIPNHGWGITRRTRTARERLARISLRRAVAGLRHTGQDIGTVLGLTPRQVRRIIRTIELLGDPFEVSAEELILRNFLEGSDRVALIEELSAREYTPSSYAPYPAEGRQDGTWEQVRHAYMTGYLTPAEYAQIRAAAGPATSE